MLDPSLRTAKDAVLLPLARRLGPGVHPNLLSLLGFAVGVGCALLLLRGAYGAALALWLLNRTLDGLDGVAARAHGRQSDFGGYLDLLLDFGVYALIPICLAVGAADPSPLLLAALGGLLGSYYLNAASWMYLSAILEKRALGAAARGDPTSVAMPSGLVEGFETIVFYSLFMLMPGALVPLFAVLSALVLVTVAQRVHWALRHL